MCAPAAQPRKESSGQSRKTAVSALILLSVLVLAVLVVWRAGFLGHDGSGGALANETTAAETPEGSTESVGSAAEGADRASAGEEGAARETDAASPSRLSTEPPPSVGVVAQGVPCPVAFPSGCRVIEYSQGAAIESWKAVSAQDCRSAARELLLALQADGFELVKAGYSDLAGEAWSCAVKSGEDEAFVISLLPQHLGSSRDSNNQLTVTVVRIGVPDITLDEGSAQ